MRKIPPIARSKTAALSRILDLIPKGYTRYTTGKVSASKAARVIQKFHDRHHIGATPGQTNNLSKCPKILDHYMRG